MTVYVVAGSAQEFERWLGKGGTRYENETVCLLPSVMRIRRMRAEDRLVLLEHWRNHPQWRQIYNTLLSTGRTGVRK